MSCRALTAFREPSVRREDLHRPLSGRIRRPKFNGSPLEASENPFVCSQRHPRRVVVFATRWQDEP